MIPRPSVLIVSNGRGEDAVGAAVGALLRRSVDVLAYPLVGLGDAYRDVPLLDPRRVLPSGGFALRAGLGALLGDLRAGGMSFWRQQRRTLAARKGWSRLVVAVGDVYALWMASLARDHIVFVATAKSERIEPHRAVEIALMRRHAQVVFTRDGPTAEVLRARTLDARFAGNPLVDVIPSSGGPLPLPPDAPVVLLLPGSRPDAPRNMAPLLMLARRVTQTEPAVFTVSLPPSVEMARVIRDAAASGWTVDGAFLRSPTAAVFVTRDFGAAVRRATVAVGLAGTANEQAAALGVPVATFAPRSAVQYTPAFLRLQHRLLGDALIPADDWERAADVVIRLLRDAGERSRRGSVGRERMGPPGAVPAITAEVESRLRGGPA